MRKPFSVRPVGCHCIICIRSRDYPGNYRNIHTLQAFRITLSIGPLVVVQHPWDQILQLPYMPHYLSAQKRMHLHYFCLFIVQIPWFPQYPVLNTYFTYIMQYRRELQYFQLFRRQIQIFGCYKAIVYHALCVAAGVWIPFLYSLSQGFCCCKKCFSYLLIKPCIVKGYGNLV